LVKKRIFCCWKSISSDQAKTNVIRKTF